MGPLNLLLSCSERPLTPRSTHEADRPPSASICRSVSGRTSQMGGFATVCFWEGGGRSRHSHSAHSGPIAGT